jgi:hypothetical protein
MQILEKLSTQIKWELNLLYTVPPFQQQDEWDCGWFCREHAFHCFVLCQMLHVPASILQGDFVVKPIEQSGIQSLDSNCDHAWCKIQDTCPVDLSMTFQLFNSGNLVWPQLDGAVIGAGKNGSFEITYSSNEIEFRKKVDEAKSTNWIGFLERKAVKIPINDLIDNPYLFFHKPAKDGWAEVHGVNIFSKICLHLYKVYNGHEKPLYSNHTPYTAIRAVKAKYGAATPKIKRIIRG